jgi:hypothetical protein
LLLQREENYLAEIPVQVSRHNPPVEFQYNLDEIFSKPISNQIPEDVLFDDNPSTVWLRTQLLISNNSGQSGPEEINTHFTSPLYQQYLRDSEFDMVRYWELHKRVQLVMLTGISRSTVSGSNLNIVRIKTRHYQ